MAYDVEFRDERVALSVDADWYDQDDSATFVHFMKNGRNLDGRVTHQRVMSIPVEVIRFIERVVDKDGAGA